MAELYNTLSVCPTCLRDVRAQIVERDGEAVMLKRCPEHGRFQVVLSAYGQLWDWLRRFHDVLHPHDAPPRETPVLVPVTMRCNLGCPFCLMFAGDRPYHEPTLEELAQRFARYRRQRISIFGGEPTMREDLPRIIQLVQESGNAAVLLTNGLKMEDLDYCRRLRRAGPFEVYMTFDGFGEAAATALRGRPVAAIRQVALANLDRLGIPVFLSVTIGAGLNDHQLSRVVDFAVATPIIRGIYFRSCVALGRHSPPEHFMRSDQMIDALSEQTGGRIDHDGVMRFLAMFIALQPLLGIQRCWSEFYYAIFRRPGGGYTTVGEVLDLDGIFPRLERYASHWKAGRRAAALASLGAMLPTLLRSGHLRELVNIVGSVLFVGLGRRFGLGASQHAMANRTILLGFNELCNCNTFDLERFPFCPSRTVEEDGQVLSFCESNLNRQRRWQNSECQASEMMVAPLRLG